jgi:hypothetical protein
MSYRMKYNEQVWAGISGSHPSDQAALRRLGAPRFDPGRIGMTRPARFSQADVTRALKAVERAGLPIAGIEISAQTGNIRVLTGEPEAANDGPNPLDRLHG